MYFACRYVGISLSIIVSLMLTTLSLLGQPARLAVGKAIFEEKCSQCHGQKGDGNGPAAAYLSPRPRDLTSGKYKLRTTESGSIPTDNDILNSIQNGLHGTAMPDWRPFLGGDSLIAVVEYVKSLSPRFQTEKPEPVSLGNPVPATQASISAGKKVYEKLQCGKCHGTDGAGMEAISTDLKDEWNHDDPATNLTEPWTFRGGSSARDIYLRFRTGLNGSPMPSYKGTATETEMWNLANYVISLGRKPVWSMNEKELMMHYEELDSRAKKNPAAWGKHLVSILGCAFCHTPVQEDGTLMEDLRFAGGQKWFLNPFGDFVTYNLTSDKETGLGGWKDDEIKTFLTKGIRRDGSRMLPFPMSWPSYAGLKEQDLNAVIAYLRTLPPVYNKIPTPKSSNIFSYLWGKFRMLILKEDLPSYTYPGNAGTTKTSNTSN